jgi:hypothetical protein
MAFQDSVRLLLEFNWLELGRLFPNVLGWLMTRLKIRNIKLRL